MTLMEPQAVNSYLGFFQVNTGRSIGKGLNSNPAPTPFVASIPASELTTSGVPGVSASDTAAISAAMLADACPFAAAFSPGLTVAQCYAIVGGQVRLPTRA